MKKAAIIIISLTAGAILGWSIYANSQVTTKSSHTQKEAAFSTSKQHLEKHSVDTLEKEVKAMSLEDKTAQLLMVGFEGSTLSKKEEAMIQQGHVGGVILLGRNVQSEGQLQSLVTSIRSANTNSAPLFIGIDEEGGRVSRIPSTLPNLPSSEQIGEQEDSDLSFQTGQALAQKVKQYGINMDFAPVLDINNNPDNEVIGDRSFGSTPEKVSKLGMATMNGIRSEGVVPVVKHFPGHGDTSVDSHAQLPVIDKSVDTLRSFEWVPFQKAIQAGADAIMTAHILFPALDEEVPATFSKEIISGVLREQMDYQGLIITDDMAMGAIANNYGTTEAAIQAVEAGVDMVMLTDTRQNQFQDVHDGLVNAVEKGKIAEEQINQSVMRILSLKQKYELSSAPEEVNEEKLKSTISTIRERVRE
ncbi:beta-N-acetylhexosaminidase [Halobacillus salinus]|uniref:beta-N-acetylhexosaminidase n=1 Tax=Halobacillus salinus TaxID=192814 RepID=A0A4Z0GY41_9BACI|nr:beta-N-acetylhexosaminidase [Halobacillus salinus]TGB02788.1 beta-N-acetylhexosaminidase [Halobacillus salinus]